MNDKYLHYQVEDFIADDVFVEWILTGDQDAAWNEWLKVNQGKQATAAEARMLIKSLKFSPESIHSDRQSQIWDEIEKRTASKVVALPSRRAAVRIIVSIAAAAAIALLIFLRTSNTVIIDSVPDRPKMAVLPSESKVELLGHSSISYKKDNWEKERRIKLKGEAIFDVTKGVPFIVDTDNGSVRVLGTRFRVVSKDHIFYVIVESGRVEVTSRSDKQILTANQNFVKSDEPRAIGEVTSKTTAESMTSYHFERGKVDDVFRTIEAVYDVEIKHPLDESMLYNGSFKTTDDVTKVLESVCWTLGYKVTIEKDDKTIYISTQN